MTTDEEIERERERIRDLVISLANVLTAIEGSGQAVGTALDNVQAARQALDEAKADFVKKSDAMLIDVSNAITGLPGTVASEVLSRLNGAVQTTIKNSLKSLTDASTRAEQAAVDLREAIDTNVLKLAAVAVGAGTVAGAVAGGAAVFLLRR